MTDYLLVHGPGQGAWVWGKVWGMMTAPEEHPPRLHKPRRANRVQTMDLPGHGPDVAGDTSAVRFEECVEAVLRVVEREGLRDIVLVGHGLSAAIVSQAAAELPSPPRRLVFVGGSVPEDSRRLFSGVTGQASAWFRVSSTLSSLTGRELRVPSSLIRRLMCNTMETMEYVQILGYFGPLPKRLLKTGPALGDELQAPLSCVILTQDRLVSPQSQRQTARRLNCEDVIDVDSCHMGVWHRPEAISEALLRYA